MSSSTHTTCSLDPLAESSRYTKVEDLGSNATGVLQLARNTETGKLVAIQLIERGARVNRPLEADILNHRSLRHTHVVCFEEVFVTSQHLCIVMEYANHGSLYSFVKSKGRLNEAYARWFFQQLIIALDYCYQCGVVNNNIRLENMLLKTVKAGPLPLLKLCDFEYIKAHETSRPPAMVQDPGAKAPEALMRRGPYDIKRADIWSCGIVLYTLLAGRYPDHHKLWLELQQSTTGVSGCVPDGVELSPECLDLLGRMLVKDPAQRLTMEGVMGHPWFTTNLPEKALHMNEERVGKEDYSSVQSLEDIRAVLSEARLGPVKAQLDANSNGVGKDVLIDAPMGTDTE